MIDASRAASRKDGPKNRLREQDIHRIVDTFARQVDVPRYARMVPFDEIAGPEERFQPQPAALHRQHRARGLTGHRRLTCAAASRRATWTRLNRIGRRSPACAAYLFESAGRPGLHARLKPDAERHRGARSSITPSFWQIPAKQGWDGLCRLAHRPATPAPYRLRQRAVMPRELIESIAEKLLAAFREAPLLDAYDVLPASDGLLDRVHAGRRLS